MTVSACLIVRDEAARIAACLASVAPWVDEVVVADTGSTDDTATIARGLGARVLDVPWTDDFAAARNAAAAACRHDWVLSVDADERLTGRPADLPAALVALDPAVAALSLAIEEVGGQDPRGTSRHRAVKLYRRGSCRWQGRVHEHVAWASGPRAGEPVVGPALDVLLLRHDGYADPAAYAAKIARNLRLARREVADLASAPADRRIAALVDLGRTALAAARHAPAERAEGVRVLEQVRAETSAGSQPWLWATDFLAWDAIGHGDEDRAWALAAELAELADPDAGERHLRPLAERLLT